MTADFYNTVGEKGSLFENSKKKALTQQHKILDFFQRATGRFFGPTQIQNEVLPNCPLTSIRRAMTNLTTEKKLVKSDNVFTTGRYGKREHCWRLARCNPG
ncbi:MAG: hypothetical protein A2167_05425 [Planctomycetes bacterium RBG_13_46_10]|nr:MAG: hypothetical protein A2167_05425 [Planctomycetes bacterium RBG_13_46_10]